MLPERRKPSILIVEDDPICRKILETQLSNIGICDCISDGVLALDLISSAIKYNRAYEIIFLDIKMPSLDGREILKSLRNIEDANNYTLDQRSKVVMVTGDSSSKAILGSFKEGCEAYVTKPIDTKKLLNLLTKLGYEK